GDVPGSDGRRGRGLLAAGLVALLGLVRTSGRQEEQSRKEKSVHGDHPSTGGGQFNGISAAGASPQASPGAPVPRPGRGRRERIPGPAGLGVARESHVRPEPDREFGRGRSAGSDHGREGRTTAYNPPAARGGRPPGR